MAQLYKNIKSFFTGNSADSGIITFCKTEYGSDWFWAYRTYQTKGKFPSIFTRIQ